MTGIDTWRAGQESNLQRTGLEESKT